MLQLNHGHSQQLVDALLQRLPQVPAALRQRLLAGAEGNPFYLEELVTLGRRALTVQHDGATVEGTLEYAFSHQMLHQVTYGTVLKPMRRELHARTARWLASQRGARAHDHLAATAEHYLQAGLDDALNIWRKACG